MRALLDTSFFIASESGRQIEDVPDLTHAEVSVMTVAELTIGVLVSSVRQRPRRLATLTAIEQAFEPLPVSAEVSREFARIAADLRKRKLRAPIIDALIAATAVVEGIPVVTQDRGFESFKGVEIIQV